MASTFFCTGDLSAFGWTLTFADEFQSFNQSLWSVVAETHSKDPNRAELDRPENVWVEGGQLVLRTAREPFLGSDGRLYNFTGARLSTQGAFYQKLGRFEANMSLPSVTKNFGAWPAFWLLPFSSEGCGCWPTDGEIDVMEANGNPFLSGIEDSYHWSRKSKCGHPNDRFGIFGKLYDPILWRRDWQIDWHVYAVEWFEDRIDYFVDDVKHYTVTKASRGGIGLPDCPMYIIFDQFVQQKNLKIAEELGLHWARKEALLRVEYVRVYSADDATVFII